MADLDSINAAFPGFLKTHYFTGIQNSLHATLYHFILQCQKLQYWEALYESIQRKLERLHLK